jgi:hypothetical protein
MNLNLATCVIIFLFSGGMITYFYALIEEGRGAAPFYMKLATFAAFLTITATFTAVVAGWIGLLA